MKESPLRIDIAFETKLKTIRGQECYEASCLDRSSMAFVLAQVKLHVSPPSCGGMKQRRSPGSDKCHPFLSDL